MILFLLHERIPHIKSERIRVGSMYLDLFCSKISKLYSFSSLGSIWSIKFIHYGVVPNGKSGKVKVSQSSADIYMRSEVIYSALDKFLSNSQDLNLGLQWTSRVCGPLWMGFSRESVSHSGNVSKDIRTQTLLFASLHFTSLLFSLHQTPSNPWSASSPCSCISSCPFILPTPAFLPIKFPVHSLHDHRCHPVLVPEANKHLVHRVTDWTLENWGPR